MWASANQRGIVGVVLIIITESVIAACQQCVAAVHCSHVPMEKRKLRAQSGWCSVDISDRGGGPRRGPKSKKPSLAPSSAPKIAFTDVGRSTGHGRSKSSACQQCVAHTEAVGPRCWKKHNKQTKVRDGTIVVENKVHARACPAVVHASPCHIWQVGNWVAKWAWKTACGNCSSSHFTNGPLLTHVPRFCEKIVFSVRVVHRRSDK